MPTSARPWCCGVSGLATLPFDYTRAIRLELVCRELRPACPVNGKQDAAVVTVAYEPDGRVLEYGSFAEYLRALSAEPITHELATVRIVQDLEAALAPSWLVVETTWAPVEGVDVTVRLEGGG